MNPLCNYVYGAPIQVPVNTSPQPCTGTKRRHDDVTRVILSRENSLKYSSTDYEVYINSITCLDPLTPSEQREMKRQRRLIKNREYAQTSRNKKKEQFEQISVQLTQLQDYNAQLVERVYQLEDENSRLKEENMRLQGLQLAPNLTNSPLANSPLENGSSPGDSSVLDSILSSSDEEPSQGDSIFDNFNSFGTDLFGNFDLSQPVTATTLFIFCTFFVLPFISVYAPNLPGTPTTIPAMPKEFGLQNEVFVGEEILMPCSRNLLMTENQQSPWPKDQIDQYQNNQSSQTIITMEDVYIDEVLSHNITELTLKTNYLKGTHSFVQHDK